MISERATARAAELQSELEAELALHQRPAEDPHTSALPGYDRERAHADYETRLRYIRHRYGQKLEAATAEARDARARSAAARAGRYLFTHSDRLNPRAN